MFDRRITTFAFLSLVLVLVALSSQTYAQEEKEKIDVRKKSQAIPERMPLYPQPFLNRYHPDWPARGYGYDVLEEKNIPYYSVHRRIRYNSETFRPMFDRRAPFSRRERWPYRKGN